MNGQLAYIKRYIKAVPIAIWHNNSHQCYYTYLWYLVNIIIVTAIERKVLQ